LNEITSSCQDDVLALAIILVQPSKILESSVQSDYCCQLRLSQVGVTAVIIVL